MVEYRYAYKIVDGWETLLTENDCTSVFHLPEHRAEFYAMHATDVV